MSQETTRRDLGNGNWISLGPMITDRAELARRAALHPDDGGVGRIEAVVVEVVGDREARGLPTDLLAGVLGLVGLLSPEQRLELLRRLQSSP
jgi:hypothetical protein